MVTTGAFVVVVAVAIDVLLILLLLLLGLARVPCVLLNTIGITVLNEFIVLWL